MWHSSSRRATAGFTLMEVLVVLACLGIILWMAGSLLFPMRQAAERQRLQVEARQTARSAADYAAYSLRNATDMNHAVPPLDPAAVLTYLWRGPNPGTGSSFPTCPGDAGCVQLSYNNVDQGATSFASDGTDIITITTAEVRFPSKLTAAAVFPSPLTNASVQYWAFSIGCTGSGTQDTDNFDAFVDATKDPVIVAPAPPTSRPLIVADPGSGAWLIYKIIDYRSGNNASSCTVLNPTCVVGGAQTPCIEVSADPDNANGLNPPGGPATLANPPTLVVGTQFKSLMVCNGWLEQKEGFFDPLVDNNCPALPVGTVEFPQQPPHDPSLTGWSALLPNVEDFQVAYTFRNGFTRNGPGATLTAAEGCNDGVPSANDDPTTLNQFDARAVLGVRVTVTARASTQVTGQAKVAFRQPPAEDHDPTTAPNDLYYRFQVSTVALLRNRATRM